MMFRLAHQSDEQGNLLPARAVAVELNELVRQGVAIAWYALAVVSAMREHPDQVPVSGDAPGVLRFINEVRRLHPLFPMVAAFARTSFEWQGQPFMPGRRVFFDVYGTNRDARSFVKPDAFDPDRFLDLRSGPSSIHRGSSDQVVGGRCAGEWFTIHSMTLVLRKMMRLRYELPVQDFRVDLTKIPARPASGLILGKVRRLDERASLRAVRGHLTSMI
jgi:fatty-acid peroxygenase